MLNELTKEVYNNNTTQDLDAIYKETKSSIPIIFVLSNGNNPY